MHSKASTHPLPHDAVLALRRAVAPTPEPRSPAAHMPLRWDATAVDDDPRKMPFRQFYDRYVEAVWRFVRSWVHNAADVEELVQEVFATAFQGRNALADPGRMHSWLYGIARNKILNHRRLSWFRRVFLRDKDDDEPAGSGPDEEGRQRLRRILERVEALPPKLRGPWEMAHFDNLTLDEIAKHEKCSLAQLKRRLREAKRRIDDDTREEDPRDDHADDRDEDDNEE